MSILSDYKEHVEGPATRSFEATIKYLRERVSELTETSARQARLDAAEIARLRSINTVMDSVIADTARELGCAVDNEEILFAIRRLRVALGKVAKRWPCSTAEDMSRVATEALGAHQQEGNKE